MTDSVDVANGVFVKFRGASVDEAAVKSALEKFGKPTEKSVWNARRGHATIYFTDESAAKKALEAGEVTVGEGSIKIDVLKPATGKEDQDAKKKKKRKAGSKKKSSSTPPQPPSSQEASIYLRDLPEAFEVSELTTMFSKFGEVKEVEVRKAKQKNGTANLVFVNFASKEGADAALEAAEKEPLTYKDQAIKIERKRGKDAPKGKKKSNGEEANGSAAAPAETKKEKRAQPQPKNTVYLSSFKYSFSEDDFRKALEPFGTVENINIKQRECHASVEFQDEADVEKASAACKENPLSLNGVPLTVEPWKSQKVQKTLHVTGFGESVPTVDEIKSLFVGYASLDKVIVRPIRKFALVRFAEPEAAEKVVEKSKAGELAVPAQGEDPVIVEISEVKRRNFRSRGPRKGKVSQQQ